MRKGSSAQDVLPATAEQLVTITRMSRALGDKDHPEDVKMTMGEAGRLIGELRSRLSGRQKTSPKFQNIKRRIPGTQGRFKI